VGIQPNAVLWVDQLRGMSLQGPVRTSNRKKTNYISILVESLSEELLPSHSRPGVLLETSTNHWVVDLSLG